MPNHDHENVRRMLIRLNTAQDQVKQRTLARMKAELKQLENDSRKHRMGNGGVSDHQLDQKILEMKMRITRVESGLGDGKIEIIRR